MRVRECISVWFKTVIFGSLLATGLSIPIIFIEMSYYVMPTLYMIIPFILITIIVSLIVSIPVIALVIKMRESLLKDKAASNVIVHKINIIHWLGGIITFIIIAFALDFAKLLLLFLLVYAVSFLSVGHYLWKKELKTML
ncbi:MAG: hypothetical protein DA407_12970 [Bacteroidetes bacterium]|nr:MAG: hypothetical protein DA407_12970 [Bacteroidota bacterium]